MGGGQLLMLLQWLLPRSSLETLRWVEPIVLQLELLVLCRQGGGCGGVPVGRLAAACPRLDGTAPAPRCMLFPATPNVGATGDECRRP